MRSSECDFRRTRRNNVTSPKWQEDSSTSNDIKIVQSARMLAPAATYMSMNSKLHVHGVPMLRAFSLLFPVFAITMRTLCHSEWLRYEATTSSPAALHCGMCACDENRSTESNFPFTNTEWCHNGLAFREYSNSLSSRQPLAVTMSLLYH